MDSSDSLEIEEDLGEVGLVEDGRNGSLRPPHLRFAPYPSAFSAQAVVSCLLPASLDLDAMTETLPGGALWPAKHRHKLAFAIHTVLREAHRRHASNEAAECAPVNVQLLQRLLGKGAKDFAKLALDTLQAWGAIELAKDYSAGRHSRLYRLGEAFRGVPLAWRSFHAPRLAAKLRTHGETETAQCAAADPIRGFILENLRSVTVSNEGVAEAARWPYESQAQQAAWALSLRDLSENPAQLQASELTGRLFHPVANCPSKLRKHLLIAGEPVAEVDVSAAQFFLLLGLYPYPSDERQRFAERVASGLFYEFLCAGVPAEGNPWRDPGQPINRLWAGPDPEASRSGFKVRAFRKLLYERLYPDTQRAGIWPAFAGEFPELAFILASRRATQAGARLLNQEMQRAEARLVLGRVIPRIRRELPVCRPISIHDAVMCQARFAPAVAGIFETEAKAVYGYAPAVKVKGSGCVAEVAA